MDAGTGHGGASSLWYWASLRGLDPCNWLQQAATAFLRCLGFGSAVENYPPKRDEEDEVEDKEGTAADVGAGVVDDTVVMTAMVLGARTPGRRRVAPGNGSVTNRSAA